MMATPTKWGHDFLVSTATKKIAWDPTITGLGDGRFVVAWTFDGSVRAQVLNADGSNAGGELGVTKKGGQSEPTITVLADGRFVVAWTDKSKTGGDTSGMAVRGKVFNTDGTKSGGEFLVNTKTAHNQSDPTIT